ncbi:MAG: glycoside hydrolase family 30 protein [Tannerellaceae bacterium]
MRKHTRLLVPLFLLFSLPMLMCAQSNTSSVAKATVRINANKPMQTIEGWGSSLCWWAAQVGNWDDDQIDEIVNLMVSPEGLNMNIFRYNIGGGDDPSHADGHMVKGKGKRAEMEGFWPHPDSAMNWKADEAQRKVMLKIKELRPDAVFEAFSNSPPYWMTYSGCAAGHEDPSKDNLRPEYYDAFCDYLIEVCKHYKEVYGIEFKTLEPFNESLSSYWNNQGSQEGCHFDPATQIAIIRKLYPMLKKAGLSNTVLAASDETNLASAIRIVKAYDEAGDIFPKLGQFNTHTYSGTNAEREELHRLMADKKIPFWQSETGPSGGVGLQSNLLLTQKLFDDMKIMQPQAWLDWQMMEEHNNEWCQFRGNFTTHDYEVIKNYYVRKQITSFFKQGYTLLEADQPQVMAAMSPDKKELVVAVVNADTVPMQYTTMVEGVFPRDYPRAYRTSAQDDCKLIYPDIQDRGSEWIYTAPAQSLTTFVIPL